MLNPPPSRKRPLPRRRLPHTPAQIAVLERRRQRALAALPRIGTKMLVGHAEAVRALEDVAFEVAEQRKAQEASGQSDWWRAADTLDLVIDLVEWLKSPAVTQALAASPVPLRREIIYAIDLQQARYAKEKLERLLEDEFDELTITGDATGLETQIAALEALRERGVRIINKTTCAERQE